MYSQFWLFLHVNYSILRNIIKLLNSIAADSIVDAISFITGVLFCDQKTSFSQIRLRLRLWPNLISEIRLRPNLKKSNSVQPYLLIKTWLDSDRWNRCREGVSPIVSTTTFSIHQLSKSKQKFFITEVQKFFIKSYVPLSMTLSDPEPQFQGHSIV